MAKYPGTVGKRRLSLRKKGPTTIDANAAPAPSTRRKFLKMAGAVTAAMLLQKQAKGMSAAPLFDSKWLAAVRLEDISADQYVCGCAESSPVWLAISTPIQQQVHWCWVAVSLGVAGFYGVDGGRAQCELIRDYFWYYDGRSLSCCAYSDNSPYLPSSCDQTGNPAWILSWLNIYGSTQPGSSPVSYNDVAGQINQVRPVIIMIQERDNTGKYLDLGYNHVAVISAYNCTSVLNSDGTTDEVGTVDIQDPFYGNSYDVPFCGIEDHYKALTGKDVGWAYTHYVRPPPGFLS